MTFTRRAALAGALAATLQPVSVMAATPKAMPKPMSPPGSILGEGPFWSARDNRLFWVDIRGKKLHARSLSGGSIETWPMPDLMNWIVLRRSGGFLVGILRTVYALTLKPYSLTPLFEIEADRPDNRLNDAKVDAQGRLWTGTMHMPFTDKACALYRIDADLSVHKMDAPYLCTNGPTFSPDGKHLYHNETAEGIIYAFDLAADGGLSGKRVFARFGPGQGLPDGLTSDRDGGVWAAHYDGGLISRYRPDGTLDFDIAIPARQVTSLTIAGPKLDRLFVTTAAQPPVAPEDKQAGTLFEIPKASLRGHIGLPANFFAG